MILQMYKTSEEILSLKKNNFTSNYKKYHAQTQTQPTYATADWTWLKIAFYLLGSHIFLWWATITSNWNPGIELDGPSIHPKGPKGTQKESKRTQTDRKGTRKNSNRFFIYHEI